MAVEEEACSEEEGSVEFMSFTFYILLFNSCLLRPSWCFPYYLAKINLFSAYCAHSFLITTLINTLTLFASNFTI